MMYEIFVMKVGNTLKAGVFLISTWPPYGYIKKYSEALAFEVASSRNRFAKTASGLKTVANHNFDLKHKIYGQRRDKIYIFDHVFDAMNLEAENTAYVYKFFIPIECLSYAF